MELSSVPKSLPLKISILEDASRLRLCFYGANKKQKVIQCAFCRKVVANFDEKETSETDYDPQKSGCDVNQFLYGKSFQMLPAEWYIDEMDERLQKKEIMNAIVSLTATCEKDCVNCRELEFIKRKTTILSKTTTRKTTSTLTDHPFIPSDVYRCVFDKCGRFFVDRSTYVSHAFVCEHRHFQCAIAHERPDISHGEFIRYPCQETFDWYNESSLNVIPKPDAFARLQNAARRHAKNGCINPVGYCDKCEHGALKVYPDDVGDMYIQPMSQAQFHSGICLHQSKCTPKLEFALGLVVAW